MTEMRESCWKERGERKEIKRSKKVSWTWLIQEGGGSEVKHEELTFAASFAVRFPFEQYSSRHA